MPNSGYNPYENGPQECDDSDSDYHDNYDQERDDGRDDGGYNVKVATDYLRVYAHSTSQAQCAKAVRAILEACGLSTERRPGSAKDYDTFLPSLGFYEMDLNNYTPQAGDIVVHEAKESYIDGHIGMYDGSN